jgi:hypothetical protein
MKCLFRLDGPASESPSRWRSCDHCRKIKRLRTPSAIGSTGWITGTSYERCRAWYPTRVVPTYSTMMREPTARFDPKDCDCLRSGATPRASMAPTSSSRSCSERSVHFLFSRLTNDAAG